jgi:hypothetical protein
VAPNATCVRGATVYHDAISTGIAWNKKSEKWVVVDRTQPLWTESFWSSTSMEQFTMDHESSDIAVIVAGIAEFILSILITGGVKLCLMKRYKLT